MPRCAHSLTTPDALTFYVALTISMRPLTHDTRYLDVRRGERQDSTQMAPMYAFDAETLESVFRGEYPMPASINASYRYERLDEYLITFFHA
jgi:hypothetical protein